MVVESSQRDFTHLVTIAHFADILKHDTNSSSRQAKVKKGNLVG